jgi:arginine-tRNA-protein transferase
VVLVLTPSFSLELSSSREIQTGSKARSPFSFIRDMHASEASSTTGVVATHDFSAVLEPSSYTDEKFALYVRYQKDIHHEDVKMPDGFTRFLVDSPLSVSLLLLPPVGMRSYVAQKKRIEYISDPPEHLPLEYGSYHQVRRRRTISNLIDRATLVDV